MQLNILPKIKSPDDLRQLNHSELNKLADELRHFTIETVTEIGGHLAPTLGVIELTVALHKVFDTPKDKIVWDVGHQGYAHKILTGRLDKFNTIRKSSCWRTCFKWFWKVNRNHNNKSCYTSYKNLWFQFVNHSFWFL